MSTSTKVELVASSMGEYGLGPALSAVDLPRSTWFYRRTRAAYDVRHAKTAAAMLEIATESPEYGYRRMATELSDRLERPVNTKVVRRLAQCLGLVAVRQPRAPRKSVIRRTIDRMGNRANLVAALDTIDLFEVVYTDFTELPYGGGKAWLILMLDHASKDALGFAVGLRANTDLAIAAWQRARERLRRLGVAVHGTIVHHDRDSVFTSERWVRQLVIRDRARLSYALRGARDNPEMESWNGRFKSENADFFTEARTLSDLQAVVERRIRYYAERRRHSTLGNVAPRTFVRGALRKMSSQ
jgi:putative transposase